MADEFDKTTYVCCDAAYNNIKPTRRRSCLDMDVLLKQGLTQDQMINALLLFYKLLFPIGDPKHSGVVSNERMPYYTYASVCTNVYAASSGVGKERGRKKDGSKHVCSIEPNEAHETYLNHYYRLDNADHMIKNTGNWYIMWKYWHTL
jgi:hypothetical protein